jgi:hypothetical protein
MKRELQPSTKKKPPKKTANQTSSLQTPETGNHNHREDTPGRFLGALGIVVSAEKVSDGDPTQPNGKRETCPCILCYRLASGSLRDT